MTSLSVKLFPFPRALGERISKLSAAEHPPKAVANVGQGGIVELLGGGGTAIRQEQHSVVVVEGRAGGGLTTQIGHHPANGHCVRLNSVVSA